jgi:hypothetical protein
MADGKKTKNQMTGNVIGKSKWWTQNKKWLIKKAKMEEEKKRRIKWLTML